MTDGVIKGDGTSRLAKASGWPETYEGFKALAESSGIPLDLIFNSSGWQQLPTFLNKANLLQDLTAQLLGLDPANDPTVDDAFLAGFLASSKTGLVKIRVYETGTQTPIGGVHITGVTDTLGNDLYADAQGVAFALATSETSTIKVSTDYIDLTGQTVFSGATPAQQITEVTLYATRVSNPSGKTETFTTSTQKMFTDKVARVDVHCVGGGAGGGTGGASSWSDGNAFSVSGGRGGGGGASVFKNNVSVSKNVPLSIVVGGKGQKGIASSWDSVSYGTTGGASSAFGVIASGGSNNSRATGGYIEYSGMVTNNPASSGDANTVHRFGESSLPIAGGGDGGGGAAYMSSGGRLAGEASGSAPNGGDGGTTSGAYPQKANPGTDATGYGGGGGGGATNDSSRSSADGGDGYQGVVYVRWFY